MGSCTRVLSAFHGILLNTESKGAAHLLHSVIMDEPSKQDETQKYKYSKILLLPKAQKR